MGGKHVDWRVIPNFPDYEINPIGEVRTIDDHSSVNQFQHYGVWAYTLTRISDQRMESWVVTKSGLTEVTFPDAIKTKRTSTRPSY